MTEQELILQTVVAQRNQLLDQVTILSAKLELLNRERNEPVRQEAVSSEPDTASSAQ